MILLYGTGKVALRGVGILRTGAHGGEFGGEGCAFWIAQAGLRAALKAGDGRAAPRPSPPAWRPRQASWR